MTHKSRGRARNGLVQLIAFPDCSASTGISRLHHLRQHLLHVWSLFKALTLVCKSHKQLQSRTMIIAMPEACSSTTISPTFRHASSRRIQRTYNHPANKSRLVRFHSYHQSPLCLLQRTKCDCAYLHTADDGGQIQISPMTRTVGEY